MSDNHHTPITPGSALRALTVNEVASDLDSAISGVISGEQVFERIRAEKLGFNSETEVALSAGAITVTTGQSMYRVSGSGDLTTINGGEAGQVIVLRANDVSIVTMRPNAGGGNIKAGTGFFYELLLYPNDAAILVRDINASVWRVAGVMPGSIGSFNQEAYSLNSSLYMPRNAVARHPLLQEGAGHIEVTVASRLDLRNSWALRAAAATIQPIGIAAPTIANSLTHVDGDFTTLVNMPTTSSSGNPGGFRTATFNLVRWAYHPVFSVVIQMSSDLTSQRIWTGLINEDITNVDTPAGTVDFAGFRYSSVAGDTVWKCVLAGAGSGVSIRDSTMAVLADYTYRLSVVHPFGAPPSWPYFILENLNTGARDVVTTGSGHIPSSSGLGAICRIITQTTAIRNLGFSRMVVEYD